MFSEILSCVRKRCHVWTQLIIDDLLHIITRFLYLPMILWITWAESLECGNVPQRPGMWSKKDQVRSWKTWHDLENSACSRKPWLLLENAVMCTHEYYVRNIWLENQIRKKWMVLPVVISVADNNCIPESTNNQQSASQLGLIDLSILLPKQNRNVWAWNVLITYMYGPTSSTSH